MIANREPDLSSFFERLPEAHSVHGTRRNPNRGPTIGEFGFAASVVEIHDVGENLARPILHGPIGKLQVHLDEREGIEPLLQQVQGVALDSFPRTDQRYVLAAIQGVVQLIQQRAAAEEKAGLFDGVPDEEEILLPQVLPLQGVQADAHGVDALGELGARQRGAEVLRAGARTPAGWPARSF